MPIYVNILLFFGALAGFFTLTSILLLTGLFEYDNVTNLLIHGLLFIGFAFALYYPFRRSSPIMHSFSLQMSTMFMLSGKLLVVSAAYSHYDNPWVISAVLGLLCLLTYFIYNISFDRVFFPFLFFNSLMYNILDKFGFELIILIYLIVMLALMFIIYFLKFRTDLLKPFEISCLLSLCVLSTIIALEPSRMIDVFHKPDWQVPTVVFNFAFSGFAIAFILHIGKSIKKLHILFACVGLLILSLISNAGILWGIAILMMGYQKYNKALLAFGSLFLIVFLIFYYYDLSLGLDYKSYILMGNGLFLLLIRYVMRYLKWDQL